MGTHPIFESDFDCLTEMGEAEKISSLLAVSVFLLWPLLFSSSTLFFSERQQTQLKQLGRARASIWRLDKDAAAIQGTFGGIRQRHETLKLGLHNTTSQIREMKELSRSKFIRLKGIPRRPTRTRARKYWSFSSTWAIKWRRTRWNGPIERARNHRTKRNPEQLLSSWSRLS